MRHRTQSVKLGRSSAHRKALVASLVCGLIKTRRIKTTLAKARLARSAAEKMVTLARQDTVFARRRSISLIGQKDAVNVLFSEIVPICEGRSGGYTRILKLGRRSSDGSEMAILEWVGKGADVTAPADVV